MQRAVLTLDTHILVTRIRRALNLFLHRTPISFHNLGRIVCIHFKPINTSNEPHIPPVKINVPVNDRLFVRRFRLFNLLLKVSFMKHAYWLVILTWLKNLYRMSWLTIEVKVLLNPFHPSCNALFASFFTI